MIISGSYQKIISNDKLLYINQSISWKTNIEDERRINVPNNFIFFNLVKLGYITYGIIAEGYNTWT